MEKGVVAAKRHRLETAALAGGAVTPSASPKRRERG